MTEEELKTLAGQLRKPDGDLGQIVGERMNDGNRILNEWCIRELSLEPGQKIVEVGMGNGMFVKDIFQRESSIHYTGCDFSETMIEMASRNNQNLMQEGKVAFVLSNAKSLPFKSNSIDIIFTNNTIYFYDDPKVEIAEYCRVLKPNGKLYFGIRPKSVMEHYPMTKYGFKMFEPEELASLLENSGFNKTEIQRLQEPPQELMDKKLEVESCLVSGIKAEL